MHVHIYTVCKRIFGASLQNEDGILSAFKVLEHEPCLCLWDHYFTDFSYSKLHHDTPFDDDTDEDEAIGKLILEAYVHDLKSEPNLLYRIAKLHIRFYTEKLNLSRVAGVLHLITKIRNTLRPMAGHRSLPRENLNFGSRASTTANLASLIVHELFQFLQLHSQHTGVGINEREIGQWYDSYHEVVREK